MTRLQKKCFMASVGMHALLLVILIASAAFRSRPVTRDIPIVMTMVNVPVTDEPGAGGGSPGEPAPPRPAPQPVPQMAVTPPTPQPVRPAPQTRAVEPTPPPRSVERPREPDPTPQPDMSDEATLPAPKPPKKHKEHVVVPTFDSTTEVSHRKTKPKVTESQPVDTEMAAEARAAARRAAASRLSRELAAALDTLASGVRTSGAKGTVVDVAGANGGSRAFVGYETYIYNAYYRAWVAPEDTADKHAITDVKIIVERDGTILSSEIIQGSGDRAMDRSVEQALRRVQNLPHFPEGATDEQRTFIIQFNLEAKEGTG